MGRIIDLDGKPFSFDPEMQSAVLDIPQIASRYIEHPASGAYEGPERNGCERPPPW